MSKHPLKYRDLLAKLKPYGIVPMKKQGKDSEVVRLKPKSFGSKRGLMITIKHHANSTEIYLPVINAVLRRFGIDEGDFWEDLPVFLPRDRRQQTLQNSRLWDKEIGAPPKLGLA